MTPDQLPKIVTAAQMRAIDERAIAGVGIPGLTLMENAGRGIATVIRDQILDGDVQGVEVGIVCGRGNNGGDGFVVGRYLSEWGASVRFFLIGEVSRLKGDAKENYERAKGMNLPVTEIGDDGPIPDFAAFDLIVDAIFGTGFRGPIKGTAVGVVEAMNTAGKRIVAVDSPSGLDSDGGAVEGSIVTAKNTITLACSKRGQWIWPGREHVGRLETVDIGIPDEAVASQDVKLALITELFVQQSLPVRPPTGHKGTFGKALIIGGSVGMSGAVALAANSSCRSGAGLTYAGVPSSLADAIDTNAIEPVVLAWPEVRQRRTLALRGLGEIVKRWDDVDAVAIGPGLSRHHESLELARRLIARRLKPTVLDADGLFAFAKDQSILETPIDVPLIITPHVGEMARLLNKPNSEIAADREGAAREAAERFNCIAVMKGGPTFVGTPDGQVYLNPTGNAGMGSGGVGDVLTGVIVSFLAQGCKPLTAALMGVYIHGLAGDFAAADTGERSLVASDLVAALPDVLQHLE